MVQRHGALVGEEDFPLGKVDDVCGTGRRGQEGRGERLGERAAGDGHLEGVVALNAGVLALDHVGSQGLREGVGAWESV